jgi:hypothetical protein
MKIKDIGSTNLTDAISKESGYMCVRAAHQMIGVCLSKELDGDVEIFLRVEDCEKLISWLISAIAEAKEEK